MVDIQFLVIPSGEGLQLNKSSTNIAQFLQTFTKRTPSIKRTLWKVPKVPAL